MSRRAARALHGVLVALLVESGAAFVAVGAEVAAVWLMYQDAKDRTRLLVVTAVTNLITWVPGPLFR
jgi:uncharacterized membrane protein (DUF4010 family)